MCTYEQMKDATAYSMDVIKQQSKPKKRYFMDTPRDQPLSPDVVTIPRAEYEALKKDQAWLRSLEGAGVDNWDGYSHAADSFAEDYPEYKDAD